MNDDALESRARRAAKRVGLYATKSKQRTLHANNLGGFQLIDPRINGVMAGSNYVVCAGRD